MRRLSCLGLLGLLLIGCGEPTADPTDAEPATPAGATAQAEIKLDYVSDDIYEKLKTDNPVVVVSFSADWWSTCKPLKKKLEGMANEFVGKAEFAVLDFEKSKYAAEYKVISIPHTFVIKDGEIAESINGKNAAEKVRKAVEAAL